MSAVTTAIPQSAASGKLLQYAWVFVPVALIVVFGALKDSVPFIAEYPETLIIPIKDWLSWVFHWLGEELSFGLFTFRDVTRGFSWLLGIPLAFSESVFHKGWTDLNIPPLPWFFVVAMAAIIGHYAGGRRVALIAGGCFLYLALFGVWKGAMETFSLVVITVPFGVAVGLTVGVAAAHNPRLERFITPLLDVMQATPHFAYLVPVVVLFGFGQVPALIATAIFAIPPMIRCMILGIRNVPADILESGRMIGCSDWQFLFKVEIPSARSAIMVGTNQVIMQTLAMVVIASLIGASGLGYNLLQSLETLRLGKALEQGIAITVIAIALDRVSQAFVTKGPVHVNRSDPVWIRRPHMVLAIGIGVPALALGFLVPSLAVPADSWTITTAAFWNAIIEWMVDVLYLPIKAFRTFMLLNILIPFRNALLWIPWPAAIAIVGFIAWRIANWQLAAVLMALASLPVVTGFWTPNVYTIYMVGSAVLLCFLIGFPLGLLASRGKRTAAVVMVICDTLQTFPSFIYLIPVVMLFKVGDLAAIIAIIAYASVPMIRFTNLGLRSVPSETREAAIQSGCTAWQMLRKVELPIAFPQIMLGINQTILMALIMVAITSLIGTKDLGQEILKAKSDLDVGRALVAGICIAFLGIVADRLIKAWSLKRQAQLGIKA